MANAEIIPVNGLTQYANGMRAGDRLSREMLAFSPRMLTDTLKTWDFSQVISQDTIRVTHYNKYDENHVVENENGENRLYRLDSIGRKLTRHYRGGMDIKYAITEDVDYPIMCGGFRQGKFFGEGKLGSLAYIKNAGFSSVSANKVGNMITPDGDTIPDVLRLRYHRSGTTHIDGSFRKSFIETRDSALFSTDSICHWLATDSVTHSIDKWQWYARGYRYPIIEMRSAKTYYYGVACDSIQETYYYPISLQQAEVGNDTINEYYRNHKEIAGYVMPVNNYGGRGTYGSGVGTGNSQDKDNGIDNGIAGSLSEKAAECTITPTYTTGDVTAWCLLHTPENVSVSIYSASGVLMWISEEYLNTGTHEINCPTGVLNDGVYIVSVVIGNQPFAQRILKSPE